ncbi:alpha/beta hydrolase [Actinocorallia populi]|uniref:alpha/beta hydrolase n=1 Tax=Actinocorallia populi TaxID=2079200 RepID=UPI0013005DCF|nr:alpha/beta hydrolase [Actinocorallia populi]
MATETRRPAFEGVTDVVVSERLFATADGLGLSLTRFHRADCADVVLLVHGLAGSREMFTRPGHPNLVSALLDAGFTDVWTLDHRMSSRLPYDAEEHSFTLDDVAAYDHPAALECLREAVGERRVHVVAHCLGSVTFLTSLFAGLADRVASVVSNSVSLHPRLSRRARARLRFSPALAPQVMGMARPSPHATRVIGGGGSGYGRHIRRMAAAERVVKWDETDIRLPDALTGLEDVRTPVLFLTGSENRVFTDSNIVTYRELERVAPGRHALRVLPGYGHADPFIGRNAHLEVFPHIVGFLHEKAV